MSLPIISWLFVLQSLTPLVNGGAFYGAVVEFSPSWDPRKSPDDNMQANTERYITLIDKARTNNVSIVVFPEMGLTADNTSCAIPVPDVLNRTSHTVLLMLSESAKSNSIYVVVNLLEKTNDAIYNTDIVFNSSGQIIAKYRKFNLFGEDHVNKTKTANHSYFTAFGVTFGIFSRFDIMFNDPPLVLVKKYNIAVAIFPTFWPSTLPFATAVQVQQSWAVATKVTLLAAGRNSMANGSSGSGIFSPLNTSQSCYYQSSTSLSDKLIVGEVNIEGSASQASVNCFPIESNVIVDSTKDKITLRSTDMTDFKSILLEFEEKQELDNKTFKIIKQEKLCTNGFCCTFDLKFRMALVSENKWMKPNTSAMKGDEYYFFRYRLVAFNGTRVFMNEMNEGLQVCGLVPCLDTSIETCGVQSNTKDVQPLEVKLEDGKSYYLQATYFDEVTINGFFESKNSSLRPTALQTSDPSSEQFGKLFSISNLYSSRSTTADTVNGTLSIQQYNTSIVSAALYNRVFNKDSPIPSKGEKFKMNTGIIFISCLIFFSHYYSVTLVPIYK